MFVWIHRLYGPDFRVTFQNFQDAHDFGKKFLEMSCENPTISTICSELIFYRDDRVAVGESLSIQVKIENDTYTPEEGWDYWCPSGIENITKEMALEVAKKMEMVKS
jgi:hypothetical protein